MPVALKWTEALRITAEDVAGFNAQRDEFVDEKDFCNFIQENAKEIAEYCFEDELLGLEREKAFVERRFSGQVPRIDFVFHLKSGKRVGVECKDPSQPFSELTRVVGQVLAYSVLSRKTSEPLDEFAVFTSCFHPVLAEIIKGFDLPIKLFVLDKERVAKLLYGD